MAIIATGLFTITDLNDSNIGGRNYIRNSKDMIFEDHHNMIATEDYPNAQYSRSDTMLPDGGQGYALLLSDFNGAAYELETLPHVDGEYTYSVWVNPVNDVSLTFNVLGLEETKNLSASDGWTRISITNPNPTTDSIRIMPTYTTTGETDLYLYESMLESGDRASDWSPAPEDIEETVDDAVFKLDKRLTAAELKVKDDAIVATVTQSDTYRNNMKSLHNSLTTDIQASAGKITAKITKVEETQAGFVKKVETWQRFDDSGIHMGKSDSTLTMDLSNEKLAFNDQGHEVASISNQALCITDAIVKSRFKIGKFAFVPTDTGMALIYIGDEN